MKPKNNYYHKFTTILLSLILLSCSDSFFSDDDNINSSELNTPEMTVVVGPPVVTDIGAFYTASAQRMVQNFDLYIGRYGTAGDSYFNFEKLMRDEVKALAPYFGLPQNFDYSFLHNVVVPTPTPNLKVLPSQVPNVTSAFTSVELYHLDKYFGGMYDVITLSSADLKYRVAITLLDRLRGTQVPEASYRKVRSMIEIGHRFAVEHFNKRVVPIIEGDIFEAFGGRKVAGGCINFKSAWQSAVMGGFGGAISGAYVGATGGTIIIPGLGTATGGVAGAVIGFAGGFIGGALYGIGQDVIFKCMLGATRQTNDTRCENFDFYFAHPEWCSEYTRDRIYWYSILTAG
jgi:hypothetical protein